MKVRLVFKRFVFVAFVVSVFLIPGCKNTDTSVNAFEIDKSSLEVSDVTPVVIDILKKCKEDGIRKLVFPKGTYHFYPTFAPEKYYAITNNDNGQKRTAFPIIDFDGFEIDGNHSAFIFHSKILPFTIEESSNIKISNLSIDWNEPFHLEGEVVANNQANKTFDVKVSTPYQVSDGHLYLTIEREDSPFERKYGSGFAKGKKYDQIIGQNIIWDPGTGAPIYNHEKYSGFDTYHFPAVDLGDDVVRLSTRYREVPPVGSVFVSKGEYLSNRQNPAFRLFKSQNIALHNIKIHHAGAMGLIAERCTNISLDSFNVVLKEGDDRTITTTADATHFCNCRGLISIKNSVFENMLDDATNIHGTYVRVNKILNDYQVAVETYHPHQDGYLFAEKGDSVQIIHNDHLIPTSDALVLKDAERINQKITILTFEESIKDKVEVFYGVENVSWYPSAIIENNIVRNNRARSFLISTPRKVVVRSNHFSSQMASLLIPGDLNMWNESGPCDSLIIEDNTFQDCVYGGNGAQSIIQITPEYSHPSHRVGKYSRNIIIRNNTINTFDASIMRAISVDGLVFENNIINRTDTYEPLYPEVSNLRIENCDRVKIVGNVYNSEKETSGTIKIDSKTSNVEIAENQNLELVGIK